MKFKLGQAVVFKGSEKPYNIIQVYNTQDGYKYDLLSFNGKERYESISGDCLELPNFPKGMDKELVRLGKKKKAKI